MPHTSVLVVVVLGGVAFAAAAIDALVGGGGLLNVPALLLAGLPPQFALGTNKLAGFFGTATATATFAAARAIRWQVVTAGAAAALVGSIIGARTVLHVDPAALRVVVSVLLVLAALAVALNPALGMKPSRDGVAGSIWRSGAIGLLTGFYDGFFGPGTGLFMVFLFVAWLGLDFLAASGAAKAANFASNVGAVVVFAWAGSIDYEIGLAMAVCAVAGAYVGSRLAILRGAAFVRYLFLAMVWTLAALLLWQVLHR